MKIFLLLMYLNSCALFAQKGKINYEIDHINIVVKDIKEIEYYVNNKLGFAVKPGRLHENSTYNFFLKFPDKSYIEFLTVSKAKDQLSNYYLDLIKEYPGGKPVFLFLRINTAEELLILEKKLLLSGIESYKDDIGYAQIISFDDDDLYNINIIYYTSPAEDLPKYFAHENSAASLYSVWIDLNNSDVVIKKLRLLGLDIKEVNQLPLGDFKGFEAELKNKPVYFANFPGENFIYGITAGVNSISKTLGYLTNKTNYNYDLFISSRGSRTLLNPRQSFGTWFEFLQKK